MSTAELGISLAEMIRRGKVHAICCTGANLEEDVFNLVAHSHYERVPHYRDLTPRGRAGPARPAHEPRHRHVHSRARSDASHRVDRARRLDRRRQERASACFPHEFMYRHPALEAARAATTRLIPRTAGSWRRRRSDLPIFVPGWEDSTLGNVFAAHCIGGRIKSPQTVKSGIDYMIALADWYQRDSAARPRSASSRSAAASPATSRSALSRCCTRICGCPTFPCGATSARSAIRPRATGRTRAPCRTRRSRGASWRRHAEVRDRIRRDHRRAAPVREGARLVVPIITLPFAPRDARAGSERNNWAFRWRFK